MPQQPTYKELEQRIDEAKRRIGYLGKGEPAPAHTIGNLLSAPPKKKPRKKKVSQ